MYCGLCYKYTCATYDWLCGPRSHIIYKYNLFKKSIYIYIYIYIYIQQLSSLLFIRGSLRCFSGLSVAVEQNEYSLKITSHSHLPLVGQTHRPAPKLTPLVGPVLLDWAGQNTQTNNLLTDNTFQGNQPISCCWLCILKWYYILT